MIRNRLIQFSECIDTTKAQNTLEHAPANTTRVLVYAFVFGLFLWIGIWSGRTAGNFAPAAGSTKALSALSPAPTPSNGQINLLVIGVDRLNAQNPRLESIWLLGYFAHSAHISLIPMYPHPQGTLPQEIPGISTDAPITPKGEPAPELVSALRKNNIWWNGYVIVDEIGMIEIVDFLGGVEISGHQLNGALAVSSFPMPWEDSNEALSGQTQLLRGMCAKTNLLSPSADLRNLLNMTPGHLQTDIDIFAAVRTWRELEDEKQNFVCEFPLTKASLP